LKVSVIIPTYRRKEVLRAVESVLNNGYEDVCVMVGNDGGELDLRFEDSRVKVFDFPHTGNPSIIRNKLVQLTDAEFITFLDDDDIYLPGKIEKQLEYLLSKDCDAVFCNVDVYDFRDGSYLGRAYNDVVLNKDRFIYIHNYGGILVYVGAWMMRREFFLRIGGFNESLDFLEDWEFGVRVILNGKVGFQDFSGVIHYQNVEGGLNQRGSVDKFIKAGEEIAKLLEDKDKRRFKGYLYGTASYKFSRRRERRKSVIYGIKSVLTGFPNSLAFRGIVRAIIR